MRLIAEVAALVVATGAAAADPVASSGVTTVSGATETVAAETVGKDETRKPKPGIRIKAGGSAFGTMLYDRSDQAIYAFGKETGRKSKCYGACAKAWPPVLTKGRATAGRKVDADRLGTTKRRDGSRQVTYGGHPLYYYAHEGRGEVLCHNVFGFGGLWQVIGPNGKPLD